MQAKVIFLLASVPWIALAGLENSGHGARPSALSNAFVALGRSPWSTVYNPAGLASCVEVGCAAFVSPQQFGLKELRSISVAGVFPFPSIAVGVVGGQFGFELYRETSFSLGVGGTIEDGIALGITLNLDRIAIDRYGEVTVSTADGGVLVDVTDGLRLGFVWKNTTASAIGTTGEALPQVQSFGVCYELSASSRLSLELEKDIRFPFDLKLGYEHELLQALTLRLGMSSNPRQFSGGLALRMAGFEFSYAGFSHPQLGWTHQIELSFTAGH
jgi:hypothetical protein